MPKSPILFSKGGEDGAKHDTRSRDPMHQGSLHRLQPYLSGKRAGRLSAGDIFVSLIL